MAEPEAPRGRERVGDLKKLLALGGGGGGGGTVAVPNLGAFCSKHSSYQTIQRDMNENTRDECKPMASGGKSSQIDRLNLFSG